MAEIIGEILQVFLVGAHVVAEADHVLAPRGRPSNQSQQNPPNTAPLLVGMDITTKIPREAVQQQLDSEGQFMVFAVDVTSKADGKTWRICRRYSDFRKVHEELRDQCREYRSWDMHCGAVLGFVGTLFPTKYVGPCQGDRLERRRQKLEIWLQTVLEFVRERSIVGIPALATFLACHEHLHPFPPFPKAGPALETTPQVVSHSSTADGRSREHWRPAEASMPAFSASAPPLMPSFSASFPAHASDLRQEGGTTI